MTWGPRGKSRFDGGDGSSVQSLTIATLYLTVGTQPAVARSGIKRGVGGPPGWPVLFRWSWQAWAVPALE